MADRAPCIAVIGPGDGADEMACELAGEVGRELARAGAIVMCGGLGGVMAAACQGAAACGGLTVGLLPGTDRYAGNDFLSVALPTGLGELRNGLLVRAADAVIAVGGSWGTLSEIALAMRMGKPTVVIDGWEVRTGRRTVTGPARADSAAAAVRLALTESAAR